MRILAVGNFGYEYIRDNWKQPLKEMFSSVCLDLAPLLANREKEFQLCHHYIQSLIRNDSFDYFYFYSDGIQQTFSDDFFQGVRAAKLPVVVFHADDEPEEWYSQNKPYDHRYDIIATHSKRAWRRRRDEGFKNRSIYIPWGYNPHYFYKIKNLKKKYDVVFIGKHKAAEEMCFQDKDGELRQDILVTLYRICQNNGLVFKVFGKGWEKHPTLKSVYGGVLSREQMVRIYNQSKIVFNPGFSSDKSQDCYQTKLRHYEVPGCGAFQITNENPDLYDHFKRDEEIVFYRNEKDLEDKLLYYIKENKIREKIAVHGYQRARQEHTTKHRLVSLFNRAQDLFPRQDHVSNTIPSQNNTPLPIKTIKISKSFCGGGRGAVFSKRAPRKAENTDYVQLIPKESKIHIEIDYESIRPLLNKLKYREIQPDVISVRSVIRFLPWDSDFIQVKWHLFNGFILTSEGNRPSFENYMIKQASELLCSYRVNADEDIFIFNYLISQRILPQVIEKIKKKQSNPFLNLNILHSYRIINDITLKSSTNQIYSERRLKYDALFSTFSQWEQSVVIYGASGQPLVELLELLEKYKINLLGFIDRRLAGQKVFGYPVYDRDYLDQLNPDVILISAENSGPQIYESLADWYCKAAVVPLYDIRDKYWNIGY